MATFVSSPEIIVRVDTSAGTYDVSGDINNASVTRRTGVSSFNLTLSNRSRKYDGVFAPMDRVAIYLRRVGPPLMILSGYLDAAPLFSTHSAVVRLRGSCTLKRLQHWLWDASSEAANNLLMDQSMMGEDIEDAGLGEGIVNLINTVMGWPRDQIHIAGVPPQWIEDLASIKADRVDDAVTKGMERRLGMNPVLGGKGVGGRTVIGGVGVGSGQIPHPTAKVTSFGGSRGVQRDMDLTGEPTRRADNQRAQWGGEYYCQGHWGYRNSDGTTPSGVDLDRVKPWWRNRKILITNRSSGKAVVARAADWGPTVGDARIGLSAPAMSAIDATAGQTVSVSFADDDDPFGPVSGDTTTISPGKGISNPNPGAISDTPASYGPIPWSHSFGSTFANLNAFLEWLDDNGYRVGEHPCVPMHSEILTKRGWLTHDQVQVGDETLGWNPDTDKSEWTTVRKVMRYDSAEVFEVRNQFFGLQSTDNHRWLSEASRSREPARRWMRELRSMGNELKYITSVEDGAEGHLDITDDEAALLAWVWGDGSVYRKGKHYSINIYQSKPTHLSALRELASRMSENVREQGNGRLVGEGGRVGHKTHTFYVRRSYGIDLLRRAGLTDKMDDESRLTQFIVGLSPSARRAWFDSMVDAEGGFSGDNLDHILVYQNEGHLLRAIQTAGQMLGYQPRLQRTRTAEGREHHRVVSMCKPVMKHKNQNKRSVGHQPVWCVQTDLGTWTMRQGDQVMITGNSYGGVTPGYHMQPEAGGFHWWPKPHGGGAADITWPGSNNVEMLDKAAREAAIRGLGIIWRSAGHFGHMHVDISLTRQVGTMVYATISDIPPPQAIQGGPGRVDDAASADRVGDYNPGITPGVPSGEQLGEALLGSFQWMREWSDSGASEILGGYRALMNDQPFYKTVDELMKVGLRDWCSAPNGDIIAWFPDYFARFGTAARMVIEPVEIMQEGFNVEWSDDRLKTHMFVTGASSTTGGWLSPDTADAFEVIRMMSTAGIASVEFPELMSALFGLDPADFQDRGKAFLHRFGARTDFHPMNNITGPDAEFYMAVQRFMKNWSQQFSSTIRITFMPELFPGMVAAFPYFGVQGYVNSVTHNIDLQGSGGFTTQAEISPWSSIGNNSVINGLPRGGSL